MWTVEAYNPDNQTWQRLPVSRSTKAEATRLAAVIAADYIVRTRVRRA